MTTYLITQATGQQAQWTIKHLLDAGAKVHAVVRDPAKIPDILKRPGVTIFKGESVNFDDVFQAAQGCKAAYLNTFPIPGLEAQQAKTIVEAARKAGIKSIVACTTMCTGNKELWDDDYTEGCNLRNYWRSKAAVEDIVRGAGFEAWTILRPAFIHVDYLTPSCYGNFPELTNGVLTHLFDDGFGMAQTDANDIGRYAAAALQDPVKFGGHAIELANEYLTIEEVCDLLVKVSGRDVKTRKLAPEEEPVMGQFFQKWSNARDYSSVLAATKEAQAKFGIPLTSLENALQRDKARLLDTLPVKN
ncbi:NmrA family protein [Xylaria bambusicola]|uniref:NmrA family protein n=1 Tax=Xylaria bambusicola TaxID=326684 RepID=UPI002007A5A0|nr:NmrA family protein [Xylaria bambusicola]KAI0522036.1 NmrA family protein [Xylaria bambusicola]